MEMIIKVRAHQQTRACIQAYMFWDCVVSGTDEGKVERKNIAPKKLLDHSVSVTFLKLITWCS